MSSFCTSNVAGSLYTSESTPPLDPVALGLKGVLDDLQVLFQERIASPSASSVVDLLTISQLERLNAVVIEGIKTKSIDFIECFPADKAVEGQRLLDLFVMYYEASLIEKEQNKKINEEIDREIEQLEKELAKDRLGIEEADRMIAEGQRKIAEADALQIEADRLSRAAITKSFCRIFSKQLPSEDLRDEIFEMYLADGSITCVDTVDRCFPRINSMQSIIRYFEDNSLIGIKSFDFREFDTEINDIATLVDYLKTPEANAIKGVAFMSAIPETDKILLEGAKVARASTLFPLKVQYFS